MTSVLRRCADPGQLNPLNTTAVRLAGQCLAGIPRLCAAFLLLAATLGVRVAWAQDSAFTISPGTFSNWAALQPMRERLEKSHQTIFGESVEASLRTARTGTAAGTTRTAFTPAAQGKGSTIIKQLAMAYPAASREAAEQVFAQLLAGFKQIESQFGLPSNDVATAVAAFLVGSYSAYRNAAVPDEQFLPLVKQMRQIIGNTPAFAQATAAEKQETYEQLAILGMFMATTQMALDRQPDPRVAADAKAAASGYLRAFLGTDPERVHIGAKGLELE